MSAVDDRKRIGQGFHRHAGEYDQHTIVQKRVVRHLDDLVANHMDTANPRRLLDIGCGTGALTAAMKNRYPQAGLFGLDLAYNMAHKTAARVGSGAMIVNGDAECLPFRDGAFDLVVSASTFQWVRQLDVCFSECNRVLAEGGLFCTAFFGGRTLWELHESFDEAISGRWGDKSGMINRLHKFRGSSEVQQVFEKVGFDQVVIATEVEMEYHPDVNDLLKAIKGIGANATGRSGSSGGLGWRGVLGDMAAIYRSKYRSEGMIPATYEVIYVVARKNRPA